VKPRSSGSKTEPLIFGFNFGYVYGVFFYRGSSSNRVIDTSIYVLTILDKTVLRRVSVVLVQEFEDLRGLVWCNNRTPDKN
jgi:hypothetical protein